MIILLLLLFINRSSVVVLVTEVQLYFFSFFFLFLNKHSFNQYGCHTEVEVADPTFYLTQSQYADTRLTSANPIIPGTWQGSHLSANF